MALADPAFASLSAIEGFSPTARSTKAAYEKYNWNASSALALASKANDLLEKEQYVQAAAGFRDALKLSAPHEPRDGYAQARLRTPPRRSARQS